MGMREDYQAMTEKRLEEWKAQTERLKAQAEQLEAQAKAQFEKQLELVRAKQNEAWDKFYELKKAGEGAWQQMKAGMEKAADDFRTAAERAAQQFKK